MNLESLYRQEWRRVLAATLRLTGDFNLSEEAVQDAFVAALERWPRDGAPASPYAWLVSTARNPAWWIRFGGGARFHYKQAEIEQLAVVEESDFDLSDAAMVDDQLRLIFTCCHPGVVTFNGTPGVPFLTPVAQRLVRVKRKIRDASSLRHRRLRSDLGKCLDKTTTLRGSHPAGAIAIRVDSAKPGIARAGGVDAASRFAADGAFGA